MAKRRQRQGVSGNPARGANATVGASTTSPDHAQRRVHTYLLAAALVAVALLVLFVPRPDDEAPSSGASSDAAPPQATEATTPPARGQVETTGAPRQATAEAFCTGFFAMIDEGRRAGEGKARPDRLERLADDLLAEGVPAAMSLPARTGYYEVIAGAYDSIGLQLPPEAVGSSSAPVEGANAAFTGYLDEYCPA
jgi:hypothetical protein